MHLDQRIICATSWGNDSCALVKHLSEQGFTNVLCLYHDTGWAASWWPARVERMELWAQSLGFETGRTISIGMEQLVVDHRGWPRNGMQFCTEDLKIAPTLAWLKENDPELHAVMATGVRRAESERRSKVEEWDIESPLSGGRHTWRPLYLHTDEDRDALLGRAGIRVLPHRSKECDPCVNGSRKDIAETEPSKVDLIEQIEKRLGFTGTGKPRVMFRPAKKMGATGIREIIEWANSAPGKFRKGNVTIDEEDAGDCGDVGYCGI